MAPKLGHDVLHVLEIDGLVQFFGCGLGSHNLGDVDLDTLVFRLLLGNIAVGQSSVQANFSLLFTPSVVGDFDYSFLLISRNDSFSQLYFTFLDVLLNF